MDRGDLVSQTRDNKVRHAAVIVAGGTGVRMGSSRPKQMLHLQGTPILLRVLSAFQQVEQIDLIVCVLEKELFHQAADLGISASQFSKLFRLVKGGSNRTQSVWNGLSVLEKIDIVLVHDGVRPLVSGNLIRRAISAALEYGAVIPATEFTDTVKEVDREGWVVATPPRQNYCCVQTPQAFRFELLKKAYERCMADRIYPTDDAAVVEHYGQRVHIFEGDPDNIKITYKQDLERAHCLLDRTGGD